MSMFPFYQRNIGVLSPQEQIKLSKSNVAIIGMGGVGGIELISLVRAGIGNITIVDGDVFEKSNINRQYGANIHTVGESKVKVMEKIAKSINPYLNIKSIDGYLNSNNAYSIIRDADTIVDGLDAFALSARHSLYYEAHIRKKPIVCAGPIGYSVIWYIVKPRQVVDKFFHWKEYSSDTKNIASWIINQCIDLNELKTIFQYANTKDEYGSALNAICNMTGSIAAMETIKILLNKDRLYYLPYKHQFNIKTYQYKCKKIKNSFMNKIKRNFIINKYFNV